MRKTMILFLALLLILGGCANTLEQPEIVAEKATPAQIYLETHSQEEIRNCFLKATYITDGFSSVADISEEELFRFAVLISDHGGTAWYHAENSQYQIPVADVQELLDRTLENCVFDPTALDSYAVYDAETEQLVAEALGFSTGNNECILISAEIREDEHIRVVLSDTTNLLQAEVIARVSDEGVRFLSCNKTFSFSGNCEEGNTR